MSGWATLDIETQTHVFMNRKASPFDPRNHIVSAAYKLPKQPVQGSYWGRDKTGSHGWLGALLTLHNPKFLVGFNIKFDLLHLLQNPADYAAYMAWVVRGGQLWDVQLAEYLLDGMVKESHMLSLDEVAPRYGGTLKIDEVKALWNAGVQTDEIPQQLLMDYLCGRRLDDGTWEQGDIENTEGAFLGQLKTAKQKGQLKSIQLNNGALVATVEMEKNGLYVDMELGREQAVKLGALREELRGKMQQYIPADLPVEFNWRSRRHLSALVFGGSIPYEQKVHQTDETGKLLYAKKKAEAYVLEDGTVRSVAEYDALMTEDPETAQHALAARLVYGSGKKKGLFKTKQIDVDDLGRPKTKLTDFLFKVKGHTPPRRAWRTKDEGVYSTKAEIMEELGGSGVPFLDDFATLQATIKDLGTYYITEEFDDDGNVTKAKGMLTLVQPVDSIVHHNINQTATVTARFSSSNPNLQNLPRAGTSEVKRMFKSRHGVHGVMISSDFTSLEVYCQANLSLDKQLIADLLAGLDMHCMRLSIVEKMDYLEVLALCKGDKSRGIPAVHEWELKRTDIKVYSFQTAYGAGVPKIAKQVKRPEEDVQAWADADKERYPGIGRFNDVVLREVQNSRWPTAHHTRHPINDVPLQLGRGEYITKIDSKRYVFMETPSPDFMLKRGQLQGFMPTELKNYPVQGLGGEWMKAAMWLAVRLFYVYGNFGGLALLVNTVHDALYADSHETVRRKAGVAIHGAMLAASDFMEYWFGQTIRVPVPSETTYGPSMFDEAHFEDNQSFEAQASGVRNYLRRTYMDGYIPSFEKAKAQ